MSAKRLTTGITLEPAVMHYVRTKSKELGINGSQFIESCIGLEILNPLNHKTIPKAMKIAATVELIGLEKAREALAEDTDLTLSVVPKETPIFEPEIKPLPKQGELPPSIKKIVEETVKKNIPTSEDIDAASSRGVFSSDASVVNHDIDHNTNRLENDVVNSVADDVVDEPSYDNIDKNSGSKSEQSEQIVNDITNHITNRIEEITIDSVVNTDEEHGTEHVVEDDAKNNTKHNISHDAEDDFSDMKESMEDDIKSVSLRSDTQAPKKKKRIMKMI
jgi:hypothetical protein